MLPDFTLNPIAIARTDFKQKFAIPRQSGIIENIASLELLAPYNRAEIVQGLEEFSHMWLIFGFHKNIQDKSTYKTQINPPKYPDDKKVGVLATRSPHRPNNLGLSLVKLIKIDINAKGVFVIVQVTDILDGTPIFDIKPYLPWLESKEDAKGYKSPLVEQNYKVVFSSQSKQKFLQLNNPYLEKIILQTLALDPRPKTQIDNNDKIFSANIANLEVKFQFKQGNSDKYIEVIKVINN